MRKVLFVLGLILGMVANGQAPGIRWQKCIGGSNNETAKNIKQAKDGGYVICGSTLSNDYDAAGNHGGSDAMIVKLDSLGNIEWKRVMGGTNEDLANWIETTTDNCFIVCGQTKSNDGDVTGNHGKSDAWFIKLDSNGDTVWQKLIGGSDIDFVTCVSKNPDGSFKAIGTTYSSDDDLTGLTISNVGVPYPMWYLWVIDLDSDGNIISQSVSDRTGGDFAYGGFTDMVADKIRITPDGGSLTVTTLNMGHNYPSGKTIFRKRSFVNNLEWEFNGTINSFIYNGFADIAVLNDTNYLAVGTKDGYAQSEYKYRVTKLDNNGQILIDKQYYTTPIPFYNRDYVTSIDYVNNRAIVGGYTFGSNCNNCIPTSTFNHDATGNTCDYWVMCLNDSANMIWQKCFGGSGNDYCTDVMLSKDG